MDALESFRIVPTDFASKGRLPRLPTALYVKVGDRRGTLMFQSAATHEIHITSGFCMNGFIQSLLQITRYIIFYPASLLASVLALVLASSM
jgi:hypothetical protein